MDVWWKNGPIGNPEQRSIYTKSYPSGLIDKNAEILQMY